MAEKSYLYHNKILSIPASLIYDDWQLMRYNTYKSYCQRGKLVRSREGKGKDNEALLSYHHLPEEIKEICKEKLGNPEDVMVINLLEPYITFDKGASDFYKNHRTPTGK